MRTISVCNSASNYSISVVLWYILFSHIQNIEGHYELLEFTTVLLHLLQCPRNRGSSIAVKEVLWASCTLKSPEYP